ncbi:MAG: DUF4837 family protein [Cyclobacteriaceae bacterium]
MIRIVFVFLIVAAVGCDQAVKNANKEFMQPAQGSIGEIILVMDSAQWNRELGTEIKRTFHSLMPGLPQDETLFRLFYIDPYKLNTTLKTSKNLIFVTTLDNNSTQNQILKSYFTNESLKRINSEPDLFMITKKDDFAKGQQVLHLFGKTEELLTKNIADNRDRIRNIFETVERERLNTALFASTNSDLQTQLKKEHGYSIKIPYAYQLAKNEENFTWVRYLEQPEEKSFFIYYEPYTNPDLFNKDAIAALREKITAKYMRDLEDKDTFMTLQDEKYMPYYTNEINFDGKYAFELRGLWKLNDISAGGPFLSFTFVDESRNRVYYIEGYVYHPSGDKRDWMREMETILKTFEVVEESGN